MALSNVDATNAASIFLTSICDSSCGRCGSALAVTLWLVESATAVAHEDEALRWCTS